MQDSKTSASGRSARLACLACLAAAAFARAAGDAPATAAANAPAPPSTAAPPAAAPADQHIAPTIAPQYAELARKLSKTLPEYPIVRITPSSVDGILEVLMEDNRIVYVDTSGKHLFNGHLFDLDAHEDLTERRIEALTRIDV
jgi:thiol:disulfide interchange protein DsbC